MYFYLPPDTYDVNTLQEKNVYSNEKEWLCNHHKVITIMRISSEKTPFFYQITQPCVLNSKLSSNFLSLLVECSKRIRIVIVPSIELDCS